MTTLCSEENYKITDIKPLSEECSDSLKSDCDIINKCYNQLVIFQYLQKNLSEYSDFLINISGIPNSKFNYYYIEKIDFIIEANKYVLNILSSFNFYLDNAECYLKREFGKDSSQVLKFKELTSALYDSHFSYRFLYKLRNYSLHLGFPIQSIRFKSREQKQNTDDMIGDIILEINILMMQKEKSLFGAVHKELMNIDKNIDIRPLIVKLSELIICLQKFIHDINMEKLESAINNIELFTLKYKTTNNRIVLIENLEHDNEQIKYTRTNIPFNAIAFFKELDRKMTN